MPTILAFIIITSSVMLYQTVSLLGSIYGLKAQITDLTMLEYAVNTRRVVSEIEPTTECTYTERLNYQTEVGALAISSNCLDYPTGDPQVDLDLEKLFAKEVVSNEYYQGLKAKLKEYHSPSLGGEQKRYNIVLVEYMTDEQHERLLITEESNKLLKNTTVK